MGMGQGHPRRRAGDARAALAGAGPWSIFEKSLQRQWRSPQTTMKQKQMPTTGQQGRTATSAQPRGAAGRNDRPGAAAGATLQGAVARMSYQDGSAALSPNSKWTPAPDLSAITGATPVRMGDFGASVRQIQSLLGVEADGYFGPSTQRAVRAFQVAQGLEPDALVGPTTLAKLRLAGKGAAQRPAAAATPAAGATAPRKESKAAPATPAPGEGAAATSPAQSQPRGGSAGLPAPTLAEVADGSARLKQGMTGPAVAAVQKMLGIATDGEFGPATAAAVRAFQTSKGLAPVSGEVGATTLEHLKKSGSAGVSPDAAQQMERLVAYAMSHHQGGSYGDCFKFVWKYITAVGYGKIRNYNDCADMPSGYARNFAEYMNAGNAKRWGLRRISASTPYDAPRGAIVVVGPGTPGTHHPYAGDIAVARGNGLFVNDGPAMSYGAPGSFLRDGGWLMGVYVPDI